MAIYRPEQAQLTYGPEAAFGGDAELARGKIIGSPWTGDLTADLEAGSVEISLDGVSGSPVVGDFIVVGTIAGDGSGWTAAEYNAALANHEIRRVEWYTPSTGATRTIGLDRPTGFFHANNQKVYEIEAIYTGTGHVKSKAIKNLPGVYETVDVPDMASSLEPQYFLGTTNRRSFQTALKSQQTYDTSLTMTPLDGRPLRWSIGKVTTCMEDMTYTNDNAAGGYTTLASAAKKGDMIVHVTHCATFGTISSSYITEGTRRYATFIDTTHSNSSTNSGTIETAVAALGSNPESRRVIAGYNPSSTTGYLWLDQPLQFDHASGSAVASGGLISATEAYRHVISEADALDSMSWHVHMLDTEERNKQLADGTAITTGAADADGLVGKDFAFDRRYTGGKVGSSTITAEEGGLLSVSWDTINFRGMHHNIRNHNANFANSSSSASGDLYHGASLQANMPFFSLMQSITADDIDYPVTEPYYFSDGQLQFFGQTFAQIRSFSLSINNNTEPRFYVNRSFGRFRGPSEIREQRREYGLTATVVLPDNADNALSTGAMNNATTLFRELLLEGDYGTTSANEVKGFTATLRFDRGVDDYIIVDIPNSQASAGRGKPLLANAGTPSTNLGNAVDKDIGLLIRSAPHNLTTDAPLQIDLDMFFKNMVVYIKDNEPSYI